MEAFKSKISHTERVDMTSNAIKKYPDRVPLYVYGVNELQGKEGENGTKYMCPLDMIMCRLITIIKESNGINECEAIYLLTDGAKLIPGTSTIGSLYREYKDDDGFMYVEFKKENVFG